MWSFAEVKSKCAAHPTTAALLYRCYCYLHLQQQWHTVELIDGSTAGYSGYLLKGCKNAAQDSAQVTHKTLPHCPAHTVALMIRLKKWNYRMIHLDLNIIG